MRRRGSGVLVWEWSGFICGLILLHYFLLRFRNDDGEMFECYNTELRLNLLLVLNF